EERRFRLHELPGTYVFRRLCGISILDDRFAAGHQRALDDLEDAAAVLRREIGKTAAGEIRAVVRIFHRECANVEFAEIDGEREILRGFAREGYGAGSDVDAGHPIAAQRHRNGVSAAAGAEIEDPCLRLCLQQRDQRVDFFTGLVHADQIRMVGATHVPRAELGIAPRIRRRIHPWSRAFFAVRDRADQRFELSELIANVDSHGCGISQQMTWPHAGAMDAGESLSSTIRVRRFAERASRADARIRVTQRTPGALRVVRQPRPTCSMSVSMTPSIEKSCGTSVTGTPAWRASSAVTGPMQTIVLPARAEAISSPRPRRRLRAALPDAMITTSV